MLNIKKVKLKNKLTFKNTLYMRRIARLRMYGLEDTI